MHIMSKNENEGKSRKSKKKVDPEAKKRKEEARRAIETLSEITDEHGIAIARAEEGGYIMMMSDEYVMNLAEKMDDDSIMKIVVHIPQERRDAAGQRIPTKEEMH